MLRWARALLTAQGMESRLALAQLRFLVPAPVRNPADEAEPYEPAPGPETYPHLTPAGVEPPHPRLPWSERRG